MVWTNMAMGASFKQRRFLATAARKTTQEENQNSNQLNPWKELRSQRGCPVDGWREAR